jgi:transposase
MRSDITPGQTSDYLGFDPVMDDNLPEPCVLLAYRGYDSDKVSKTMEPRNVVPVIPMRKSRKLRVAVDRTLYRLRNLVERCFNKLKNARRVATRYDKTANSFMGFIDITSIRLWLRHLSTWPKRPRGLSCKCKAEFRAKAHFHAEISPRQTRRARSGTSCPHSGRG